MNPPLPVSHPASGTDRAHVVRALRQALALALAALLAYAVWRGYQNPDLLLDLAAFRLC